jgi:threonine aldolase
MRIVDLRSDTVTRPSPAMRQAMAVAEVGDDVFGEDPTVNSLEQRLAAMFGHEAGLFCPSGTMTNQIAVNIHTRPGDEVICDEGAHIYRYEGGGVMATSGCSVKLLAADRGRFTAAQVKAAINDPSAHYLARTRLVNIENTNNRGGGSVWDVDQVREIRAVCRENSLALHLDGARIFNALAVSGGPSGEWGALFDTISVCLSKGLGAPVGSVLTGSSGSIAEARRVRKRLGGGMRQAGLLAAACHFALDHNLAKLKADHVRAKRLGEAVLDSRGIASVMPVETNIVIFTLKDPDRMPQIHARMKEQGVLAAPFGPGMLRMVVHLDLDDADIDHVITVLDPLLQ